MPDESFGYGTYIDEAELDTPHVVFCAQRQRLYRDPRIPEDNPYTRAYGMEDFPPPWPSPSESAPNRVTGQKGGTHATS